MGCGPSTFGLRRCILRGKKEESVDSIIDIDTKFNNQLRLNSTDIGSDKLIKLKPIGPLVPPTDISASQIDFFKMLDEKIENGKDFDSEEDCKERLEHFRHVKDQWQRIVQKLHESARSHRRRLDSSRTSSPSHGRYPRHDPWSPYGSPASSAGSGRRSGGVGCSSPRVVHVASAAQEDCVQYSPTRGSVITGQPRSNSAGYMSKNGIRDREERKERTSISSGRNSGDARLPNGSVTVRITNPTPSTPDSSANNSPAFDVRRAGSDASEALRDCYSCDGFIISRPNTESSSPTPDRSYPRVTSSASSNRSAYSDKSVAGLPRQWSLSERTTVGVTLIGSDQTVIDNCGSSIISC